MTSLISLVSEIRQCKICVDHLPLGARPIVQVHRDAQILIAGQAPGRKVHESGVPFLDASGNRLRDWLGMSPEVFYDAKRVAIVPMGFCYPGTGKSGDFPPRPECAPKWRDRLLKQLPNLKLTLGIGQYAQQFHIPGAASSVTAAVQNWQAYWPTVVPLPHPSPRNNLWLRRNPWFEEELLPQLKMRVAQVLAGEKSAVQKNACSTQ